jgi:hypothetical protein
MAGRKISIDSGIKTASPAIRQTTRKKEGAADMAAGYSDKPAVCRRDKLGEARSSLKAQWLIRAIQQSSLPDLIGQSSNLSKRCLDRNPPPHELNPGQCLLDHPVKPGDDENR